MGSFGLRLIYVIDCDWIECRWILVYVGEYYNVWCWLMYMETDIFIGLMVLFGFGLCYY